MPVGSQAPGPAEAASAREALRGARRLLGEGDAEAARRWATAVVDLTDDLSTWSGAAEVLRRCLPSAPLGRTARVAVLGSSTTSQLVALLPLACARAGLQVEVYEAPYGQYRQEVLDSTSGLYAFDPDAVVLALHDGDVDLPGLSADPQGDLDRALGGLEQLWQVLAERTRASVLQFTFALPPEQPFGHLTTSLAGARGRLLQELNLRLALSLPPTVVLVDCAQLASSVGTRTWFDPRYWHLARQAVSPACVPLLARQTAAVVAAVAGLSRKCLVLDLDGTLWGGVLGEDGLDGLQLGEGPEGEAFSAFQEHVLALKAKGVILAVCSKNDEPLVREAFARLRGMRLSLDDVAVLSVGWEDKPAQLRRIAADLGLGLDALVFADDNPMEREAVRRLVPEVDVLRLPADPAGYVRTLADYPWFATTRHTDDDAQRTDRYRVRAAAASLQADAPTLEAFLDSLEMRASVQPVADAELDRVTQLVGKTNQFNLTGRRRSRAEVEHLLEDSRTLGLSVRLEDRLGDHGLVGVVLGRQQGEQLDLDTWLLSCRVIGRTLEHALLGVLEQHARERGCTTLTGTYVPTSKNGLVADLYPQLGFAPVQQSPDGRTTWTRAIGSPLPPTHVRVDDVATHREED